MEQDKFDKEPIEWYSTHIMTNESELNLLGTAIELLKDSENTDDQHTVNLLRAALRIRGKDIIHQLSTPQTPTSVDITEQPEPAGVQIEVKLPKFYPEISWADELDRQREELTERVAVPLGIDRIKFLAELPSRFPERTGGFDKLALTVPLISPDLTSFGFSWLQVTEPALFYYPNNPQEVIKAFIWSDLKNAANENKLKVWKDPRRGVKPFPQAPHAVLIQDGSRYINRKP